MYATVFLILVRQRRRARASLTLCARCRHKYAIYASVWASPLLRVCVDRVHVKAWRMHARARGGCMGFPRRTRDRAPVLYRTAKRGPTFPRATPFSPSILFSSSPNTPSTAPLPFNRYPSLPSPSSPSPSPPPPSSGLNCCNLWPMPVDLTVELSHGDLYGLLILQRSSGGWNLAMGFHRFSTAANYGYIGEGRGGMMIISSGTRYDISSPDIYIEWWPPRWPNL